jgi:hypothetical protein
MSRKSLQKGHAEPKIDRSLGAAASLIAALRS